MKIYTASKVRHAGKWRDLRTHQPVISTWIDDGLIVDKKGLTDLWTRCISEAASADVLLLYREDGEMLLGALVEVGACLANGGIVYAVGCDDYTFSNHPMFCEFDNLSDAINAIKATGL